MGMSSRSASRNARRTDELDRGLVFEYGPEAAAKERQRQLEQQARDMVRASRSNVPSTQGSFGSSSGGLANLNSILEQNRSQGGLSSVPTAPASGPAETLSQISAGDLLSRPEFQAGGQYRDTKVFEELQGEQAMSKEDELAKGLQQLFDKHGADSDFRADLGRLLTNVGLTGEALKQAGEFAGVSESIDAEERKAKADLSKATSLKMLESELEKAKFDPNRPLETTITEDNRGVWKDLSGMYDKNTTEHRQAISQIDRLGSLLDEASGAGDIAAIFTFMKALDPRSVVRESEFQLPTGAGGVVDRALNTVDRWKKGQLLGDVARRDIALAAEELRTYYMGAINAANSRFKYLSERARLDPTLIIDPTATGTGKSVAIPEKKDGFSTPTGNSFTIE